MSTKETTIQNPSKISAQEQECTNKSDNTARKKTIYKQRIISMPEAFDQKLSDFLSKNPTEGRRSNFIVRIVSNYINTQTN